MNTPNLCASLCSAILFFRVRALARQVRSILTTSYPFDNVFYIRRGRIWWRGGGAGGGGGYRVDSANCLLRDARGDVVITSYSEEDMEKLFTLLALRDPFHWGTDPESDDYQNFAWDVIRSGFPDDASLRAMILQAYSPSLTWMYTIRGSDYIRDFSSRKSISSAGNAPEWNVKLSATREWQNLGKLFQWAINKRTWQERADIFAAHWNMGFSALTAHAAQPGGVWGTAKSARAESEWRAAGGASAALAAAHSEHLTAKSVLGTFAFDDDGELSGGAAQQSRGKVKKMMELGEKYSKDDSTMVQNINGTSKERYKIDKLYQKYLDEGGAPVLKCQVKECKDDASKTAHVQVKDGSGDMTWYLCRVCACHNNTAFTQPYPLRVNAKLITVREVTRT